MDSRGRRIKEVAKRLGVPLKKVAQDLDITPQYLTKLISGKAEHASPRIYDAFCFKYGVNQEWLESGTGPAFNKGVGSKLILKLPPAEKKELEALVNAFIEIMTSGNEDAKTALKSLVTALHGTMQCEQENDGLKRDIEALRVSLNP